MIVDKAIEFEKTVMGFKLNMNNITWDDSAELNNYVKIVEKSLENIVQETSRLKKLHFELIIQVNNMFSIDYYK